MTSELSLDRLEFHDIRIKANTKAKSTMEGHLPQLRIDFEKYNLFHRSKIAFPDSEIDDPRHFAVTYGIKIESKTDELMPYEIEVEAMALLHYRGDGLAGAERFRAVRFSGYQILHGAIREMVANFTARSRHGLLQIPSRNFNGIAKREAEEDEAERVVQADRLKKNDLAKQVATDASHKKSRRTATATPARKSTSLAKRKPSTDA